MSFARFGRTAACSRGDGKKIWRMAAHEGHLGRLAVRAYLVALAATLGGCSASEVVQNLPPTNAIDLAQPNHRRVVADNVRAIIPNVASVGDLEISGVRLVDHLKAPPGSPASRSTRTENRKTMPCSFRATRLSTRASASSSINATSRRLSLSTCHRLPPRKRLALDFDLFDGFIGLDLAPDRA